METKGDELGQKNSRPVCFGDEAKFVAYMENQAANSECGACPQRERVRRIPPPQMLLGGNLLRRGQVKEAVLNFNIWTRNSQRTAVSVV
jgi:hypothetical protein